MQPLHDPLTPSCDGMPCAEAATDAAGIMRREFATAYRAINVRVRALRELRASPVFSGQAEREALKEVESALLARDEIENRYARLGHVATPVVRNGYVQDIQFQSPPAKGEVMASFSMSFVVTEFGMPLGEALTPENS